MNQTETNEKNLEAMLKSGNAFRFVAPFQQSKAYEVTETDGEKRKIVELFASSDQEDLAGHVMAMSALEEMQASAVGTIMLRDHNPSTEKIFGVITEAKLVEENGKTLLWLKAEVDDEDNQNVRIWKSIKKGVKLGASVTVIITDRAPNPKRKNGLIIKSVRLLEVSIVTIPCNQDSWTLAASAAKALRIAEQDLAGKANFINSKGENSMNEQENLTEETIVEVPAETSPARKFLEQTLQALNNAKVLKARIDAGEDNIEFEAVSTKGMFNDILDQEPTLWDLYDILCTVKWRLMSQKWNLEYLGQTDFSEILAAWNEALDEFKVAAIASFKYWGEFADDDADAEVISNALDIEKSFRNLTEVAKTASGETAQDTLRDIGRNLIELAKSIGISFADEVEAKADQPVAEPIEETEAFKQMLARAEKAEADSAELSKKFEELEQNYEIAKAGLKVAVEATQNSLRQPLQLPVKTVATS